MRFAIVFTLAAAILSTSASLVLRQSVPACYTDCEGQVEYGNCSREDIGCLCNDSTFVTQTTTCLERTCQGADLQASLALGKQLCLSVGVTLTASGTVSGTASGTGTTPTSSASSNGSVSATTPTSSTSSSGSAPATTSQSAAVAHGPSTFIGLAAIGLVVALAL